MVQDPSKIIYDSPAELDFATVVTNTGQKYCEAALQWFFILKKKKIVLSNFCMWIHTMKVFKEILTHRYFERCDRGFKIVSAQLFYLQISFYLRGNFFPPTFIKIPILSFILIVVY